MYFAHSLSFPPRFNLWMNAKRKKRKVIHVGAFKFILGGIFCVIKYSKGSKFKIQMRARGNQI